MNSKERRCGCILPEESGSVFAAVNKFGGGTGEVQLWGVRFPLQKWRREEESRLLCFDFLKRERNGLLGLEDGAG
ncbi:hypothetical protein ACFX2A_004437 [Malus domestica]